MKEETFSQKPVQNTSDGDPKGLLRGEGIGDQLKIVLFVLFGLLLLSGAFYAGYWYGVQKSAIVPTRLTIPTPTPLVEDETADCLKLEKLYMEDLTRISELDCQKCGGKWELLSMDLNMTGCNPKTSDAGKSCINYDQCIGVCLAKDTSSVSGTCFEYKFILGCNLEFSEGEQVMICRD